MDYPELIKYSTAAVTGVGGLITAWKTLGRPAYNAIKKAGAAYDLMVHEFSPNSGSSMRDAIDRIETHQKALCVVQTFAVIHVNGAGRATYVSRALVAWTGRPESELLGDGWLRLATHPDDQDDVLAEWREAFTSRSIFECRYKIVTSEAVRIPVLCRAYPGPTSGHVAVITREDSPTPVSRAEFETFCAHLGGRVEKLELDARAHVTALATRTVNEVKLAQRVSSLETAHGR